MKPQNKPQNEFEERILKDFRETFVKNEQYRSTRTGWIVPFVETSAKRLEQFLLKAIREAREEKSIEKCKECIPQQKQVTENGHTFWVNGDVCEKCGQLC